jgi:hypothetical protein
MYSFSDDSPTEKTKEIAKEKEYLADTKDLGLLRACRDSRCILFENSPLHTLPAVKDGKIYFDDSTTFYIENLYSEQTADYMREHGGDRELPS